RLGDALGDDRRRADSTVVLGVGLVVVGSPVHETPQEPVEPPPGRAGLCHVDWHRALLPSGQRIRRGTTAWARLAAAALASWRARQASTAAIARSIFRPGAGLVIDQSGRPSSSRAFTCRRTALRMWRVSGSSSPRW